MPKKLRRTRVRPCPLLFTNSLEIISDYFSNPLISTLGMFGVGILLSNKDLPSYERLEKLFPLSTWGIVAIAVSVVATIARRGESRVAWRRSLILLWACYSILVVMFAYAGSWTGALVYAGLGVGVLCQSLGLWQANKWVQKVVVVAAPDCPPPKPSDDSD